MPLDGGHQRARIPPSWQLKLNVKDSGGIAITFDLHHEVTRTTTIGEIRAAAARHVSSSGSATVQGEVDASRISLKIDGRLRELDDEATAEQLDLFSNASSVMAALRE